MRDDMRDLPQLLAEPGRWTTVYVDGARDVPRVEEDARMRALRERLEEAGAPEEDATAVAEALRERPGLPSPSSRYLLVRDGGIEIDESFTGARLGPERIEHGAVPAIVPLVRHRESVVRYVVVETGREGAEIRLESAGRRGPEQTEDVQGRTDSLPKVQAGGWSHARYQHHSEEIWKQTQSEVAEVVERVVRSQQPAFVVIAGDVRARQLLRDELGEHTRSLLVEVEAHTRAAGADSDQLDEAIDEAVTGHVRDALAAVRDRAATGDGSGGAHGTAEVVAALQLARVDTLLLDARLLDADVTLTALDAAPWVADGEPDGLDANSIGRVQVAEALARAALLTGARVLVDADDPAVGEPRSEREPAEPIAALRWSQDETNGNSNTL